MKKYKFNVSHKMLDSSEIFISTSKILNHYNKNEFWNRKNHVEDIFLHYL